MNFESALTLELSAIADLSNRIYPLVAHETSYDLTRPYLIYGSSEGMRDKTLGGYLDSKEVRAELNVIAPRYADMKSITKQVITLLVGFEGRAIGTNGPLIEEIAYQMPVELYEDKPKLYRCVIEFSAFFEEV